MAGSKTKARLSSKGQLVLPKPIRERGGFVPGSEFEIEEVPGGLLLRLVCGEQTGSLEQLLGCTGYHGPAKTLADMEAATREGARSHR
ncbi:MAG TPA: AbrB/MazE/SpoVT family DNA-binding domain-containing protein [Polyangia bacterium]|jgi:AbrB family looped-hinge helix DNA binding protein